MGLTTNAEKQIHLTHFSFVVYTCCLSHLGCVLYIFLVVITRFFGAFLSIVYLYRSHSPRLFFQYPFPKGFTPFLLLPRNIGKDPQGKTCQTMRPSVTDIHRVTPNKFHLRQNQFAPLRRLVSACLTDSWDMYVG